MIKKIQAIINEEVNPIIDAHNGECTVVTDPNCILNEDGNRTWYDEGDIGFIMNQGENGPNYIDDGILTHSLYYYNIMIGIISKFLN